ncbi:Pr6Pr family membrane protein [Oerskovia flava]|uniref:Pr6Pr family membrane protein n=1 Tax=Oerskovia flava TaxID=2986422 RepID=UPI00223EDDDD|nr:Pr6Pr family membrane protein [Oerskovia sp. JB1-3-2]
MDVLVGLYRLALVGLALVGTRQIWRDGDVEGLVYFTNQTGFLVAVVFAWAGIASLTRRPQPPAWAKGAVTLFAAITGLVSFFVLAPEEPDAPAVLLGLTDGQIEHELLPLAVFVDFLLCDRHRRLRVRNAALWLLYPLAYFGFTTVRGLVSPGSEYPYGFVDLGELGWGGLVTNVLIYGVGFFVLGLVIVGIDRLLPRGPVLGSGGSGGSGGAGGRGRAARARSEAPVES